MADWQITTTTIYCDAIDDEATLLVYADGTLKCTGYTKYFKPDREAGKLLKQRGKSLNRVLECGGLECHRLTGYRDKLITEDIGKQ